MILRLNNKKEITVLDSSTPTIINIEMGVLDSLQALAAEFTKENVRQYSFLSDDGKLYGSYPQESGSPKELDRIEVRKMKSGWYTSVFLKDRNLIEERLAALEETQKKQDGAIVDIAEIIGGER